MGYYYALYQFLISAYKLRLAQFSIAIINYRTEDNGTCTHLLKTAYKYLTLSKIMLHYHTLCQLLILDYIQPFRGFQK